MMIELQPHYLDMIVQAIESAGHACLLQKATEQRGVIYVTESETSTRSAAVLAFNFAETEVKLGIKFRDERPEVVQVVSYHDGLDPFFERLTRALIGNRIEDKRRAA